jgi:hypothetical protein
MAMTRDNKALITQVLKRREQWERVYKGYPYYIRRFFTLYEGELEALLELAEESK